MPTTQHVDTSGSSDFYTESGGEFFNSFTDFKELASSRYTVVVRARKNGKWFALKALKEDYRGKAHYELLLKKEYEIGIKFNHPNIVHYIDFLSLDDLGNCIQMEFIVGQTLGKFLKSSLSLSEKKRITLQLASGLKAIHAEQVVHRDLKPKNIIITENGHNVKIIDFGFSDADSYSMLKEPAGTQGFSAPEQMLGTLSLDNRADIYSLGVILTEFGLPFYYKPIINKCCKENRDRRYNTIGDFAQAFSNQRRKAMFATCAIIIVAVFVSVLLFPKPISTDSKDNNALSRPFVEGKHEKSAKGADDALARETGNEHRGFGHAQTAAENTQQPHSPQTASEEFQQWDILTIQLHNGIDSIMNPYIERRKAGINIAEHNTFMHVIERKAKTFHDSFFSRGDIGELRTILMQEYDRYFNEKIFVEYAHAGEIRRLTAKERREMIRRQMPQLRRLQDSLYGKHRQDTMAVRP